jgi:hypothetical protein
MKIKYVQIYDGEWFMPQMEGHKMACCDCGLVHTMNFKVKKGEVLIQSFRDEKATKKRRKKLKK